MFSSSPSHCAPSTPTCLRNPLQFRPSNSSPLAESSPVIAAQARRRSQYKPRSPQTPTVPSRRASGNYSGDARPRRDTSAYAVGVPENPPKLSIRDKFRARCLERAVKAREKAIKGKRYHGFHLSSDDQPMDDDESEDEEDIMKDEVSLAAILFIQSWNYYYYYYFTSAFPENNDEYKSTTTAFVSSVIRG